MTTVGQPCAVEAHADLSAGAGPRVWSLLGDRLPSVTSDVLEVADDPQGQRWSVLLNGSRVQWVQHTVQAGDQVLAFEQVNGDLAELTGQWTVAGGRLSLMMRFHLGVDGLAPLLDPIWTQAFQAFADEIVRSVAAAASLPRTGVTA